ncbi:MAG: MFS transporter [Spirochaetales bacterium]
MNKTSFRNPAMFTLYALAALYAYLQTGIGPAVPFLRQEFHFDYTMASLHASAFAAGMVLAGLVAPRIMAHWGVRWSLWGGQLGLFAGFTALVIAPNAWFTLSAIFVAALAGTTSVIAVQASISLLAGERRSQALLEANIATSLTSAVAPIVLLVGTGLATGWRTLWPVFVVGLVAVFAFGFRALSQKLPQRSVEEEHTDEKLPKAFFVAWLFIFVGVSVEWCLGFWATSYLKELPGHSDSVAVTGAIVFQLSAVASRLISSRLTRRVGETRMLLAAIVLAAIGFPLYWTLTSPVASIVGLGLCGMAVALFYPLGLSRAIGIAGAQAAKGSSYSTVGSGSAVLTAPLALGLMADQWGLSVALLAVPVGLAALLILLLVQRKPSSKL